MAASRALLLCLVIVLMIAMCLHENAAQTTECAQTSVADIVFLVDGSTSIGPDSFQEILLFLKKFIQNLEVGADKVHVGVAQYSNQPYKEFLLKDHMDKASLLDQVSKIQYRTGGTNTGEAITFLQQTFFTTEAGSRATERVPQIAVVLTDGDSSDDVLAPAQLLRRQGVIVFAIGVGSSNMAELQGIANRPHDRFLFHIDSYEALQQLTDQLLKTVCVSMKDQRLALVQKFSDIFFLVDSGLSTADFQQVRTMILQLVNQLNVGASADRIGLAQYGKDTQVEFLLNQHKTRDEVVANVRRLRPQRVAVGQEKVRNLGAALNYAAGNFFSSKAGSRGDQGFRQFLVVVSGADSSDSIYQPAHLVKSEGVTVIAVGLGSASTSEMKTVATSPFVYQSTDIDIGLATPAPGDARTLATNLVPMLKAVFETEEKPGVVGDCVAAKVADVVFIVDESGSIGGDNFQLVRSFLHKMVESLDVSPNRVQVGIVMYNDNPTGRVYLNTFDDKNEILQFIKILPYHGGGTKTGQALNFARQNVFVKQRGSRKGQGVQQVAVVITDGESQDKVDKEAADLRRDGVTVYAIGIKNANKTQLEQMASHPLTEHVFSVNSFAKLKTLQKSLEKIVCHNIFRRAIMDNDRKTGIKEGCAKMDEANIFFLIDQSESISGDDFQDMKKFIIEFLKTFQIGLQRVRVGVVKYADSPTLEFDLTNYTDGKTLEKAVENIKQSASSGTKTGAALSFMFGNFDRARKTRGDKVQEYLIIITDGKSTDEVKGPAEQLRAKGIIIYSIGVKNADRAELKEIAGSQNKTFFVNHFHALKQMKDNIITDICLPDACKGIPGDLLFLIDSSGSIQNDDYQKMKDFMKSMIAKSQVGQNMVHVGVMQFSTIQKMEFPLNSFNDKAAMLKAIDDMQHISGGTHTGHALTEISPYFDPVRGGRKGMRQSLIVITDSESQDEVKGPADLLREKGVIIYSIGVMDSNSTQLLEISGSKSRMYTERNFDALKNLESQLALDLCKRDCNMQVADIIFLVDGSTSITPSKFKSMLKFMESVVNETTVGEKMTRFGVILYSNEPNSVFTLNKYFSKRQVSKAIQGLESPFGNTYTSKALDYSLQYFGSQYGGRSALNVPQILMVITDGDATDRNNLMAPSVALRDKGVRVFSIGVEGANLTQLQIMAGEPSRIFYVDSFNALETLYKNISNVLCNTTSPDCTVDVAIGFDMSQRSRKELLVSGYPKLQRALPDILRSVSTLKDLCCVRNPPIIPNIAFRLVGRDGRLLYDFHFEQFSKGMMDKVMTLTVSEPTFFNTALLTSFQEKFKTQSRAGTKVLVVFTDGLDEDVMKLEHQSKLLRQSGVHALLAVALDGVRDSSQLQMVEFGRGFGYKAPHSVGMQSVGSTVLKQIETVAERVCCGVICKCTGPEGSRGTQGGPGPKGVPGHKGHPGFPGDEGSPGDRGLLGPPGAPGIQGCPGPRGPKGYLGHRGNKGEEGDHGMEGHDGEQGEAGLKGGLGERGRPGNAGNKGISGEDGVPGQRGLRGDPGVPGSDNTVVGQKGEPGNAGALGIPGDDGVNGGSGTAGHEGPKGRRGPLGEKGLNGQPGIEGLPGSPGHSGSRGPPGDSGVPGPRGIQGLPGPQGGPGPEGPRGLVGRHGTNGQKGQPGDTGPEGVIGPLGPRGMPGQDGRDGYGIPGLKGAKGDPGFPGYPGVLGQNGADGPPGGPGPKGNLGRGGNAGFPGEPGVNGEPGPPGHTGLRGHPGFRNMSECQLITYIRDNCLCCQGSSCPAYPTELVFGLDMSQDVTPAAFEKMRSSLLALLEDVSIAESNCPTGARVAVVGYNAHTKRLIRFQDYQRKKQLLEAVRNIALERSASTRHLGAAMRYVGNNVFKRVRQGVRVRKVAVFFSQGPTQDSEDIVTAMMEYRALNIMPAVVALRQSTEIQQAFRADDTGNSVFLLLGRSQNLADDLRMIKSCVICYDPCRPLSDCVSIQDTPGPQVLDVDLALVVDGSRQVQADQYSGLQALLGSMVEQVAVSAEPHRADRKARVALVQQSGSLHSQALLAGQQAAKLEFGLQTFRSNVQMKNHVEKKMMQQGGTSALGHTLEYTLKEVLLRASSPRKNKVLLVVVGAETSTWDQAKLRQVAKDAKCKGVAVFVVALGEHYNRAQVSELASTPLKQHLICLGQLRAEEQGYARRFIRTFLSVLNAGLNTYPPVALKRTCDQRDNQQHVYPTRQVQIQPQRDEEFEEHIGSRTATRQGPADFAGSSRSRGGRGVVPRARPRAQCQLSSESGTLCAAQYVLRWSYDRAVGLCTPFWYGGCDGNANRFDMEQECVQTCVTELDSSLLGPSQSKTPTKESCFLVQAVGPCQDFVLSWFFDSEQSECARFWYGGCGGNGNRFKTQEDCENLCLSRENREHRAHQRDWPIGASDARRQWWRRVSGQGR